MTGQWFFARPLSPLKNDGELVNGFRMTSLFYEMENDLFMFQTTNQMIFKHVHIFCLQGD